ncbi:MAG TPA: uroporphyrinogen decarboxylase family protein [bacterium]|nr:uroporphyrinogen decarboxylase family protein [bacterium]HPN42749.1 uroporphyrinogen decarboxylase family protein [bacterium]
MMMTKSRERLLKAITHQEPDRVPVDFCATPGSGICAIACNRLKKHLAISSPATSIYDVINQQALPELPVLDALQTDVLDIAQVFNTEAITWQEVLLADGSVAREPAGVHIEIQPDGSRYALAQDGTRIATMPPQGAAFEQTCFPYLQGYPLEYTELPAALSHIMSVALPNIPWNHINEKNFWLSLRQKIIALRATTDRALVVNCGCSLFELGASFRRNENFLIDMLVDINHVKKLIEQLLQQHLVFLDKVCTILGDLVDVCRFSDTLGMNAGPFVTPDTYRHLFKPGHKILNDYVHTHSTMRTMLHCRGSIYKIMPDMIDAGFEIINPIQSWCADMEPQRLKREFGRDITLWGGGCDTKNVLTCASPASVKTHVLERLKILAPQGGFVFAAEDNIPPEVPPENIMAMIGAIKEFNGE